jgi:hypothetical protein
VVELLDGAATGNIGEDAITIGYAFAVEPIFSFKRISESL